LIFCFIQQLKVSINARDVNRYVFSRAFPPIVLYSDLFTQSQIFLKTATQGKPVRWKRSWWQLFLLAYAYLINIAFLATFLCLQLILRSSLRHFLSALTI